MPGTGYLTGLEAVTEGGAVQPASRTLLGLTSRALHSYHLLS